MKKPGKVSKHELSKEDIMDVMTRDFPLADQAPDDADYDFTLNSNGVMTDGSTRTARVEVDVLLRLCKALKKVDIEFIVSTFSGKLSDISMKLHKRPRRGSTLDFKMEDYLQLLQKELAFHGTVNGILNKLDDEKPSLKNRREL